MGSRYLERRTANEPLVINLKMEILKLQKQQKSFLMRIQKQQRKAPPLDSYGIQKQETHIVGFKVRLVAHPSLRKRVRKGR